MLSLSVRVGQAVQIGEEVAIRVEEKSGKMVRLVIATHLSPITILPTGIIPQRFAPGIAERSPRAVAY